MFGTGSIAKGAMVGSHFLGPKLLIGVAGGIGLKVVIAMLVAMNGYGNERRLFLRTAERSLKAQWALEPAPGDAELQKRQAILHDIRSLRATAERGWRTRQQIFALLRVLKASAVPLLEDGANASYDAVEDLTLRGYRSVKDGWSKLTREV